RLGRLSGRGTDAHAAVPAQLSGGGAHCQYHGRYTQPHHQRSRRRHDRVSRHYPRRGETVMRVSTSEMADSSLYGIMSAYNRFDEAQTKVNTGKQVQKPSDDPSGTAQSLDFRQNVSNLDQYGKTMDQAKGFMGTSETALDSVSSLLR